MIVMGDVSGKGLSSALYMAGIRSALHAHWEDGLQLAHTMSRLEGHARRTFRDNFFLTMVLGEIDASGRFRYCNAGHLPPVVISANGETRELEGSDPALNVLDVGEFQQYECDLVPGDLLFLFTDGLVEAQNSAGEQFGCERLCAVASKHRNEDLAALRRKILEEVVSFADSDRPGDDRTLILVKRP
jgi:sigma-B regulation protein RsbU (phosphoserine phosphatase)